MTVTASHRLSTGDFPVVGHNLIGFDLPVLDKLWGITVDKSRSQGHLGVSRLANPHNVKVAIA